MKLHRRNPQPHQDDDLDHEADGGAPGLETWTNRNRLITRATTAGLVLAIALAPAHLVYDLVTPDQAAVASPTSTTNSSLRDQKGRVGLYARDAVVAYLSATQTQSAEVKAWFSMFQGSLPEKAPKLSDPVVASADMIAPDRWTVRVAVTVGGVRQYLQVPVAVDPASGAISTMALPQPVPGPLTGAAVKTEMSEGVSPSSSLGITLSGFTAALAAGQGDITRYTSPGSTIAAIAPRPFEKVAISSITSDVAIPTHRDPHEGGTAQVMVRATGTGQQVGTQEVSWVLTVKARAGRWEVFSLDSVPGIRSGATPSEPTQSPAVPTSTSMSPSSSESVTPVSTAPNPTMPSAPASAPK